MKKSNLNLRQDGGISIDLSILKEKSCSSSLLLFSTYINRMKRRTAIKSSLILAGATLARNLPAESEKIKSISTLVKTAKHRIPQKGEEFNESVVFPDEVTSKLTRQITTQRLYNVKPTYHINAGFTPDNRHTVFATYNDETEGSALVCANVETGDCKVLDHTKPGESKFAGGKLSTVPGTDLVVAKIGLEIRLYDVTTGDMELIVPAPEKNSNVGISTPIGTVDGKSIIYPRNDTSYSWRRDTHLDPFKQVGVGFYKVDIKTGKEELIYRDDHCRSNHVLTNPVNSDLIIIDRDWPELFSAVKRDSENAKKTRVWVLKISTGEFVYYHGPSFEPTPEEIAAKKGISYTTPYRDVPRQHYIGVADWKGNTIWEAHFPMLTYGHCGSHATKNIMVVDNLLTEGYLTGIHWDNRNEDNIPHFEMIGKHNSVFRSGTQPSHPHSQISNNGKWLIYNAMIGDDAHVYALKL